MDTQNLVKEYKAVVMNDMEINEIKSPLENKKFSGTNSLNLVNNSMEYNFIPATTHKQLMREVFTEAEYVVNPYIEKGAMNMISAAPNTWKSWLILLFANNIASGSLVFDTFKTDKNNIMIVNEEDSSQLIQKRLRSLGIIDDELPIFYRIGRGSKLNDQFVDALILEAKSHNIGVIMFDSLRAMHDAEENTSTSMQIILDLLKKINREGITVIFTHHNRKKTMYSNSNDPESTRGSSAINAAISGHISLEEKNGKDGEKFLIIRHLKSKMGEKHKPLKLKINTVNGVSFDNMGEYNSKEESGIEIKKRIMAALEKNSDKLLGRKDLIYLKVGCSTTVKNITDLLVEEGKIFTITRKEAEVSNFSLFSPKGSSNELLYFIKNEENTSDDN